MEEWVTPPLSSVVLAGFLGAQAIAVAAPWQQRDSLSCLFSECVLWLTGEGPGVRTYCPGSTRSKLEPNTFTSCSS